MGTNRVLLLHEQGFGGDIDEAILRGFEANGFEVTCELRGMPWEPRYEYVYPHSTTLQRFEDFDADIVILGHTHYQMAERVGRTLVINPGSAGESRDARIDYRLSYAVLDTVTEEVIFGNFPDPVKLSAAGGLANAAGQPYTGL